VIACTVVACQWASNGAGGVQQGTSGARADLESGGQELEKEKGGGRGRLARSNSGGRAAPPAGHQQREGRRPEIGGHSRQGGRIVLRLKYLTTCWPAKPVQAGDKTQAKGQKGKEKGGSCVAGIVALRGERWG